MIEPSAPPKARTPLKDRPPLKDRTPSKDRPPQRFPQKSGIDKAKIYGIIIVLRAEKAGQSRRRAGRARQGWRGRRGTDAGKEKRGMIVLALCGHFTS